MLSSFFFFNFTWCFWILPNCPINNWRQNTLRWNLFEITKLNLQLALNKKYGVTNSAPYVTRMLAQRFSITADRQSSANSWNNSPGSILLLSNWPEHLLQVVKGNSGERKFPKSRCIHSYYIQTRINLLFWGKEARVNFSLPFLDWFPIYFEHLTIVLSKCFIIRPFKYLIASIVQLCDLGIEVFRYIGI